MSIAGSSGSAPPAAYLPATSPGPTAPSSWGRPRPPRCTAVAGVLRGSGRGGGSSGGGLLLPPLPPPSAPGSHPYIYPNPSPYANCDRGLPPPPAGGRGASTAAAATGGSAQEDLCACGKRIVEGGCAAFNPKLVGTVKKYDRHVVICAGGEPSDWSAKITKQKESFANVFKKAADKRKKEIKKKYKLTNSDEPSMGGGTDVIIFPERIRYIGVTEENVAALIGQHLVNDRTCESIKHEPFTADHLVLVCCHGNRDTRCGTNGPEIVLAFQQVLAARSLGEDKVIVRRSSHLGGHKYAAVVVIYPAGDWYGFVTKKDIENLVDNYITSGMLVQELWRGRMGIDKAQAKRLCALEKGAVEEQSTSS